MQWVEGDKQFTWGHLELGSLGEVASRWWIQAACRKCPRLLWLPPRHRQVQSMPWRWWHHTREECSIGRKNKQIKGKFLGGEIGHQAPPCCCSVDKSCPTLCNPVNCSARPPCPSQSPRVSSNSCPLSRWCHPIISSSATPFSSSLQPLPTSESFPTSWFFSSGDQSIEASA